MCLVTYHRGVDLFWHLPGISYNQTDNIEAIGEFLQDSIIPGNLADTYYNPACWLMKYLSVYWVNQSLSEPDKNM